MHRGFCKEACYPPLLWVSKFLPVLLQGQGDGVFSQVMQWESLRAWESIDTSTAQSKETLGAVQPFHVLVSIDANPLDHSRVLEKETTKTQGSAMGLEAPSSWSPLVFATVLEAG